MSYLTQLQTNNTNLQACINKANALPEAGSGGGGGSVETCTVNISSEIPIYAISYFGVKNGSLTSMIYEAEGEMNTNFSITCLCNSFLVLHYPNGTVFGGFVTDNVASRYINSNRDTIYFTLSAPSGGVSTINIKTDSGVPEPI